MKKDTLIIGALKMEVSHIKDAVHTGFGREKTRNTLQEILKNRRPSLVISIGLVGAVSPDLRAGDIFIPGKIIDYEKPDKVYKAQHPFVEKQGTLVTVHKVFERHDKYELKKKIPEACAVDMETSAVGEILEKENIPLLCIKAVSDELDFDFSNKKTLSINVKKAIESYTNYICRLLER